MKVVFAMMIFAAMSGCGADGEPFRPTANMGVSIGSDGVTPSATVGATNGPLSVSLGL